MYNDERGKCKITPNVREVKNLSNRSSRTISNRSVSRSVESRKHRWKHRFPKQGVNVRVDAFEANGKSENTAG